MVSTIVQSQLMHHIVKKHQGQHHVVMHQLQPQPLPQHQLQLIRQHHYQMGVEVHVIQTLQTVV
jgi:hypothetical protein